MRFELRVSFPTTPPCASARDAAAGPVRSQVVSNREEQWRWRPRTPLSVLVAVGTDRHDSLVEGQARSPSFPERWRNRARSLPHEARGNECRLVSVLIIDRERHDFRDWPLSIAHDDFLARPHLLQVLCEMVAKVRDVGASHLQIVDMAIIAISQAVRQGGGAFGQCSDRKSCTREELRESVARHQRETDVGRTAASGCSMTNVSAPVDKGADTDRGGHQRRGSGTETEAPD